MKYVALNSFWKRYRRLDPANKDDAKNAFKLFKQNPRHPSLRVAKMAGLNIWYGHVTKSKVFTFEQEHECFFFRNIGRHEILDKERRR